MATKTIIGLDVGNKRIGVAIASLTARLPAPHGVIGNDENALRSIRELALAQDAQAIVVGLPRNLAGSDTDQTQTVRDFADDLRQNYQLPIYFQDEALTSKQAEKELRDRRVRYTKEAIDALAATYILADFLREHAEVKL